MDKAYSNIIKALCLFAETLLGFILGKVWKNVKNIMKKRIKINNIRRANKIVKEIQVHIDCQAFTEKPNDDEMSVIMQAIHNRITKSVSNVSPLELANLVGNLGQSVVLATMQGSRANGNMIQQQALALDFDNSTNKKAKLEGASYQTYDSIKENEFTQKYAAFMYKTLSHTEDWERFRVIFILETPLYSAEEVRNAYKYLLEKFPHADQKIKDCSRLFMGGRASEEINYNNELPINLFQSSGITNKHDSTLNNQDYLQSVGTHLPTYKLIKQGRFKEVSERWKKYGDMNFPDTAAAIKYFRTLPMAELLQTPPNPFRNLFERDFKPSCSIWNPKDTNTWLYTQQNATGKNGNNRSYDIIRVMQKLLRQPYKKYHKDLPYDMAVQFLIEHTGIKIDVSEEIEIIRNQADLFNEVLLSDTLMHTDPDLYQIFSKYKYSVYIVAIIDIFKMNLNYDGENIRCLTYMSLENLAIRLQCSKHKVSKLLNLMAFTGIIAKLDEDKIPEELLVKIKKSQTHEYRDDNWLERKVPRKYHNNIYELTNGMEDVLLIKGKCAELISKGFTQKAFSKEWVERSFGKAEADRVFPQDKNRAISEVSKAITEDIHKVALEHIQAKGYVIVNELKAEIQHLWGSKGFVEYKYQQAIGEMLESYDIKKVRLTRELKNQLGITDLSSKVNPTILMKNI